MHDPADRNDVDRAYRAAVAALSDGDSAARRRATILGAAREESARSSVTARQQASNEPKWHSRSTWVGATAAACMAGISLLLVLRLADDPAAVQDSRDATIASRQGTPPSRDRVGPGTETSSSKPGSPEAGANPSLHVASADGPVDGSVAAPAARRAREPDASKMQAAPPAATLAAAERRAPPQTPPAVVTSPPAAVQAQPSQEAPAIKAARVAGKEAMRPPIDAGPAANASPESGIAAAVPKPAVQLRTDKAQAAAPAMGGTLSATTVAKADTTVPGLIASATAGDLEDLQRQLATTQADAQRDADGRTALAIAVLRSDARMVLVLLAHGANRLSRDKQGRTPVDHAMAIGNPSVLEALER